ncbi:hypothetical protein WME73_17515 [Sorangium sp. So ce302]|uniref:hypothetical protein n=1 Tax=Sorangium sp. So ce302 TaxID=3133297 RepID=UPI003F61EE1D
MLGAFAISLTRRELSRVAFIPISVRYGTADPSVWVAALHARLGQLTRTGPFERALTPRVADDIRPLIDGDETPEIPLLIILDGAGDNNDPAVWSRLGLSEAFSTDVRVWVSVSGVESDGSRRTAAERDRLFHRGNEWSELLIEDLPERPVAELPEDVDFDTAYILAAASGPMSEAELARVAGSSRSEDRVKDTLERLGPWLSRTEDGVAFLDRAWGEEVVRRSIDHGLSRGHECVNAYVRATLDGVFGEVNVALSREEYVVRYGSIHLVGHEATGEEIDRIVAEPMRAAWESLDGGAFGFRALVVAAWRRSHSAFLEAVSEAERVRCMVQALRLRTIFEQLVTSLVHALPETVAGAIREGIFQAGAGVELAKPLSAEQRIRLWKSVRPAVSPAAVAWPEPLLGEAERAVAELAETGSIHSSVERGAELKSRILYELKSRRMIAAPVIGALVRIAERLSSPARDEVLLLAERRLSGLRQEDLLVWSARIARLCPDERRVRLLHEVDAGIVALPSLEDRLDVLAERLRVSSEDAAGIVHTAMGWVASADRFPVMASRFLPHVPECEWSRMGRAEARVLVRRWQGESRGYLGDIEPLLDRNLPAWLADEVRSDLVASVRRVEGATRVQAASEYAPHVGAELRAELARLFFSEPPGAFRGKIGAVENWAALATLEELRHIYQDILPHVGPCDDDAFAALFRRAVELGDRDLATSFCAAMEGDDRRHQAELRVALALGSFSDVERLVRPDLEDEEASGMLEMVGKALKREEDAARFAELVRGAVRASNRLAAWGAVFPSLSLEARERLSGAVAETVKETLRERPEESDDTLCSMFPWMSVESLCDVWRERASPEKWRSTIFEATPLFTYDRGYRNGALLDTLLLRMGGEAALVAWARTLAELDEWFSEIGPWPD